ncbi:S-layer homology domain-containing protein [Phormidium sp. FACHB-1136]|uniref:S-layer homology domain-containing protein n=1 Tax=Phormidium sp. FACHB-1136 TaxID=2692848 RepID=UPI0018EFA098|nr:S-layer homology domain-containing protein [Phormidium sp. FACHB-1136]
MARFASSRSVCLGLASALLATGCAGGSLGDSLQRSLEADPQLQAQFPAKNEAAQAESDPTSDDSRSPLATEPDGAADGAGEDRSATRESASDEDSAQVGAKPGDATFIGPLPPTRWQDAGGNGSGEGEEAQPPQTTDASTLLDEVPTDLKPYVQDWITLGITAGGDFVNIPFQPSRPITRGDYAHWLFAANNQFFSDQPAKRIRPGSPNSTPAFQDVPPSHPDFAAIQGLAEAGIIPSALSGNAVAVTFRPDDTLTRENLLLWKVPLDTRAVLPMATVEAVQSAWGFQDAAEIEPLALRAVLADRQTGDFANILRVFGFTTLFQPKRSVSQAEAAAVLWRFGHQTEGVSVQDVIRRGTAAGN